MDLSFEDRQVIEVGNYCKGWYGNFTGSGDNSFNDLAVIFGHLCGLDPKHVSRQDIFLVVDSVFRKLVSANPSPDRFYCELYNDVFFRPWSENLGSEPVTRLLNKMLCLIMVMKKDVFPGGDIVVDGNIARLFDNGVERMATCMSKGFKLVNG
jgi:hypothetical protein